jgi:hypothetical protein
MLRNRIYIGRSRARTAGCRRRNHPDFPLRGFVRCEACGRPLTGSWSKGRNGRYAYYHCQRRCRAVNVSKAALEGAFVDGSSMEQFNRTAVTTQLFTYLEPDQRAEEGLASPAGFEPALPA